MSPLGWIGDQVRWVWCVAGRGRSALATAWLRLRAWRRVRFTAGGTVLSVGALAVGLAAINTANNLLYLLLGAMLGLIAVSSWLSEQAIRSLDVRRHAPRGITVGHEVRLVYDVANRKARLSSVAIELREEGLPGTAFLARVPPGAEVTTRSINRFVRRGIYPLGTVTISTSFPFGLFFKERDVEIPAKLVVWPRHDRPVRTPFSGSGRPRARGIARDPAMGTRGDYRTLRPYRPGDDPKDIHWRTSARLDTPVVREYDRDASESLWICLDLMGETGSDATEELVEMAASIAARAAMEGKRFGIVAGRRIIPPRAGPGQLEAVLHVLARVRFGPDAAPPAPPVDPGRCVLVTSSARGSDMYGDVLGAPAATLGESAA